MYKIHRIFLVFALLLCFIIQQDLKAQVNLIPKPQEISLGNKTIEFSSLTILANNEFDNEIKFLKQFFAENSISESQTNSLQIRIRKGEVKNPFNFNGAYSITVSDEVVLQAPSASGIFYGIQTLKQLIGKKGDNFSIPEIEINDWAAFKIRGFMHDVGRNYQSPELLKEQIDVLASYKYNVFHMHLSDNPGWRLESKLYPELQANEATSRKPGMYYTQEEIKDLIEYCRVRHITLIPEIDIPGHTAAFRKALEIKSMNSSEVQKIIIELIDELCALASPEIMPYIHLGTDEVRERAEKVDEDYLVPLIQRIEENGRQYISWWHGIKTPGDNTSIKQLWAQYETLEGHPYIDSRSNYINHLDPLAGIGRLFFQQPCRAEHGDSLRLGGILCCWPDNRVEDERKILQQNAVYPFMLAYSETIWRGVKSTGDKYWAQLPPINSPEYKAYQDFEGRILIHRDKYFVDQEFPFVRNAQIPWKIIGPINHKGDFSKSFEVEKVIKESYEIDGDEFSWNEISLYGGTIHLKHFFGFPSTVQEKKGTVYALNYIYSDKDQEMDFWIGFHGWSRSGGRRGGPSPELGQWHTTNSQIWVNEKEIAPPVWKQPGLAANTPEIPFVDEDYYYRQPSKIKLKKGWNKFLLKVPHGGTSWKWMFTCVPVMVDGNNVREVEGLKYATEIEKRN